MPRSGETVPASTHCQLDPKMPQSAPPWAIAAGLICAFGIWYSPGLLLVYVGLTTAIDWQPLLGHLALAALSASCLRLLLGCCVPPVDEAPLLLALLVSLTLLCAAFVLSAQPLSSTHLPWLALCAGLGGGGFAALCGPPLASRQGLGYQLETTTLLGHLGIVSGLLLLPWLMTQSLPGDAGQTLLRDASHFLGRVSAGAPIHVAWLGYWWGGLCLLTLGAWWLANPAQLWSMRRAVVRIVGLFVLGMGVSWGAVLVLHWLPPVRFFWLLPLALALLLCLGLVRAMLADYRWQPLANLFGHRHLWVMSASWMATLGTFLGLALCFPILTAALFSPPTDTPASPDYPGVFLYAWMLPLAALLMRPLGRWAARRFGGIRVSLLCLLCMMLAALAAARASLMASEASYVPEYFTGYLVSSALLFIASGLAHAALVQSLPAIFPPLHRHNASTWLMTMATVGMACVIYLFAEESAANYHRAFIVLAVCYGLCALLNAYLYLRRRAFIYSP